MNFVFICVCHPCVIVCQMRRSQSAALWAGQRNIIISSLLDRYCFLMGLFCSGRLYTQSLDFICGDLRENENKHPPKPVLAISDARSHTMCWGWWRASGSTRPCWKGPSRQGCRAAVWSVVYPQDELKTLSCPTVLVDI